MKKFILSIVAALAVTTVMAQTDATSTSTTSEKTRKDPTEIIEKRTQKMVEKYGLTTEQAAKLKTLNEKYMGNKGNKGQRPGKPSKSNSSANSSSSTERPDSTAHKGHGGMHGGPDMTAYNTELKSIMTDDQYKAYTADMANRKNSKKSK